MPPTPPSANRAADALRRAVPVLLTLLAVGLAWQGQQRFVALRAVAPGQAVLDPASAAALRAALALFGAAALALLAARFALFRPASGEGAAVAPVPAPSRQARAQGVDWWRWTATATGLALLAWVLLSLAPLNRMVPPPAISYAPYVWGWLGAVALMAGAWLPPLGQGRGGVARAVSALRTHPAEALALAAIVALAAWLRLTNLGSAPLTVSGDEGSFGLEALRALSGDLRSPFVLTWGPVPSLSAFVMAAPLQLFGTSIAALRSSGALAGTLAVAALWALARPIAGRSGALLAALALATLPMHLHYSRVAVNVGWDSLFFTGALALFWWGMRRERDDPWPFVVAGLVGGLGQYFYTGSRLLPLLLVATVAFVAVIEPERLRRKAGGLLAMALIFGVVAAPIYLFAYQFPNEFNARVNQVGILQNGWLEAETAVRGQGRSAILWDQFRRALFGFAFFEDRTVTWGPGTPLVPPVVSLGLFLGLVASLRRWRDPAIAMLHGWFWAIVLAGGMLTVNPPTSNRLVGATPVVCLFAALGWGAVTSALARAWPGARQRAVAAALLALVGGAMALTGIGAHNRYLASNRFGGGDALLGTMVGYDLAARPADTTLVLLAAPRLRSDFSPLAFLTPDRPRREIVEPLGELPADLPAAPADLLFVIVPERTADMNAVLAAFPDAQLEEVRAPDTGELLYYRVAVER